MKTKKIQEIEKIFLHSITTPIVTKDNHKVFLYSKRLFTQEEIDVFESLTSKELEILMTCSIENIKKFRVDDIPKNYGEH